MQDRPLDTIAVREVQIRYRGRAIGAQMPISAPLNFVKLAKRIVTDDAREHFLAIYLDGRSRPVGHSIVSVGTATASLVHPREIFQPSIMLGAVSFLIGHNHPSGDPRPSREDESVTKRLREAGEVLGVRLIDHVVWTRDGAFHSFMEEGQIPT